MNKEEILKKIELNTITKQDLFDYYAVKNVQGLEIVLDEKMKELKTDNNFIGTLFPFVFKARDAEEFSPLAEKFYMFSVALPGLYGIPSEEVNILARGLGLFEACMLLENLLSEKPEFKYLHKLYVEYVQHRMSVGVIVKGGLEYITDFLDKKLKDMKMEDLQKLAKGVVSEFNNIKLS